MPLTNYIYGHETDLVNCFFSAALFISSCKLDKPNFTNSGGGSVSVSNNYLLVTSGTYWKYLSAISGSASDTVTVKLTGGTTNINGRVYYNITSTSKLNGVSTGYYYNANHIYTLRANTMVYGITIEIEYLNDTTAVGHTYTAKVTDSGDVNGVPAQLIGTVVEKGITKIIGGKTFTDVVHTLVELQYDFGSGFEDVTVYDFYLAKGIGLIETDTQASEVSIGTSTIIDYLIK